MACFVPHPLAHAHARTHRTDSSHEVHYVFPSTQHVCVMSPNGLQMRRQRRVTSNYGKIAVWVRNVPLVSRMRPATRLTPNLPPTSCVQAIHRIRPYRKGPSGSREPQPSGVRFRVSAFGFALPLGSMHSLCFDYEYSFI